MTHDEAIDLAPGYVLGALEPAEEAAVRAHLEACPESHAAFDELGGVVPYLAEADLELVEPPASLGERILAAAAAERTSDTGPATPAAGATPVGPVAGPPAEPLAFPSPDERAARAAGVRRARPLDWGLRIAAVIAIVVLGGWNLLLQGQLDAARGYDRAVAAVVAAAGRPGAQTVVLTPEGGTGPSGIAAVAADGSIVLALRDLAPTSGTQVYETWVIAGDAPVPIGSFAVGADGTIGFTTRPVDAPPGAIVAVTLEPQAGNQAPQGAIVAKGVTTAPTG